MLLWINGAFGVGKTQTAFELHRRLPGSFVADPEWIGYAIHKMLPARMREDFQDRPQWRSAVRATLADVADSAVGIGGPIIVPMTLVNADYFDEIVGGLRSAGVDVRHHSLLASPEVLRARLRTRSAHWIARALARDPNETRAVQQIDRCVAALSTDRFARHIDTDHRTIDEVVETIARDNNLPLTHGRLGALRYQLRRARVGLQHMR